MSIYDMDVNKLRFQTMFVWMTCIKYIQETLDVTMFQLKSLPLRSMSLLLLRRNFFFFPFLNNHLYGVYRFPPLPLPRPPAGAAGAAP